MSRSGRILASLGLACHIFCVTACVATAGNILRIAGTATLAGYSGDGGPALAAVLNIPVGSAMAPDGTIYFVESFGYRIRKIDPAGIITTIAGDGTYGDAGDGGPATAAKFGGVSSVALDWRRQRLYFASADNNRVRVVNLATGIISNFAGTGFFGYGFAGDEGPAVLAKFAFTGDVAVDSAGIVYITDTFNWRIRKVDRAGIIHTYAGNGSYNTSGDGGPALAASFTGMGWMATDEAGNLFVDADVRVRRIDAVTKIITTVAGGGATIPGSGLATDMDIHPAGLALDHAGHLYIGDRAQVYRVNLPVGTLSVLAGGPTRGYAGDGGPASDALVNDVYGASVREATGELIICDSDNAILRSIAPDPGPDDVAVEIATSQAILDLLNSVTGGVLMINVGGRKFLIIPNLTIVGGNVSVVNGREVTIIDLHALQSAGGNVTLTGDLVTTSVDLSALTNVGGSLNVSNDPSLTALLISNVASVGGSLRIIGTAVPAVSLPGLTSVGGSINISGNGSAGGVDLGGVTSVGGSINISGNGSAGGVDLGSLTSAGGDVDVSGNGGGVDLGSLTSSGGDVDVSGNGGGVDLGSLTSVAGDLTVETHGTGTLDVAGAQVGGNTGITADGYTTVSATTATGSTTVSLGNPEVVMTAQIPGATFVTPVDFSVTRAPSTPPEPGSVVGGGAAIIDPLKIFTFVFGVPTLNHDASLSFDVVLANLSSIEVVRLRSGLLNGTATLATKGDAPGSEYQAFPICPEGTDPVVNGCVKVEQLDVNGQPTTGAPAIVRFSNIVGHFSNWSVVTYTPEVTAVQPPSPPAPPASGPARFALAGVRPDPARAEFSVAFSLPEAGSARLEVIDITGRRVRDQRLSGLAAGDHLIALGSHGVALAPGIYMIRLSHAGQSRVSRFCVVN